MSNLHLLLPDEDDSLTQEAIEPCPSNQEPRSRFQGISTYAKLHGGTSFDLDPAIESLSIKHWLEIETELD